MGKPPLAIIHNLARGGGTVINKCIGCMEGTVMLSEIHPDAQHLINAEQQAKNWFGLLPDDELDQTASFAELIGLIAKQCRLENKTLVIRDWSHLDFIGAPFFETAPNKKSLCEALEDHFCLNVIAIVRHPIDQWLSINSLDIFRQKPLGVKEFLIGYKRYFEACCDEGFIKYEDIVLQPNFYFKTMCMHLQLPYDQRYIDSWYQYTKVTGDTSEGSRGAGKKTIRPMKRKVVDEASHQEFLAMAEYSELLELTNYVDV